MTAVRQPDPQSMYSPQDSNRREKIAGEYRNEYRTMQRARILGFFLAIAIFLTCTPDLRAAIVHEFKDGHVERSASCVIRDQQLIIEYSIGLNPDTMQIIFERLLAQQNVKREREKKEKSKQDSKNKSDPQPKSNFGNRQPTVKLRPTQPQTNDGIIEQKMADGTDDSGLDSKVDATTDLKVEPNPKTAPQPPEALPQPMTKEEIEQQKTLQRNFQTVITEHLKTNLSVQVDGQMLKPDSVELAPLAKHHVDLVITLKFDLNPKQTDSKTGSSADLQSEIPSGLGSKGFDASKFPQANRNSNQPRKLLIEDRMFSNEDGTARYSLKAKGRALLSQSNVAPILVRSKRISLAKLSPQQRNGRCQIVAEFGVMKPR